MNQKKFTIECECKSCGGTGLDTSGLRCHVGAARICRNCQGSGKATFTYTPFTGRKKTTGVVRVFEAIEERDIYPEKHTFCGGTTIDYTQYGCTIEEWEAGERPKPIPFRV